MEDIDCKLPENMEMDECMDMDHDDHEEGHGPSPMKANVQFLMTAGFAALNANLMMFRYRSESMVFYTLGDTSFADGTGNTNYWKMANSVRGSVSVAVWSILLCLQALSMAGILSEINVIAWMYGVPVWMLANTIAGMISFYGYETAYSWYATDTTTNAAGASMMSILETEMITFGAKETAAMFALYINKDAWMKGQWEMLPEETQEKWMEGMDEEDDMFSRFFSI